MLEQILRSIKNYFIKEVWVGDFVISEGNLADVDFLKDGQYFKVYGSDLNDGVYKYPATDLKDEEFAGEVWALKIPQEVINIAEEKEAWIEANKDVLNSPFSSESFGGYSYTKSSSVSGGSANGSGGVSSGTIFDDKLAQWRRIIYEPATRRYDYVRNP